MIVDFTLANSTSQMESYNKQIDGFFLELERLPFVVLQQKGRKNEGCFQGSDSN